MQTQKNNNNNNMFCSQLNSAGTQHGNLPQLSIMMSRVTYFILQAYTGSGVSHSQHRKKLGGLLEKMQLNGPEG